MIQIQGADIFKDESKRELFKMTEKKSKTIKKRTVGTTVQLAQFR